MLHIYRLTPFVLGNFPSGYAFASEHQRYNFPDISSGGVTINRGSCDAGVNGEIASWLNSSKIEVFRNCFPTTLRRKSPSVDLSLPVAGHYVAAPNGVTFDAYLGVGQRLIDENHPRLQEMLRTLGDYKATLRREVFTNEFLVCSPDCPIVTPQRLAGMFTEMASRAFPGKAPFKVFFSNSGAEAVEAAMKLACRRVHHHILARYGTSMENLLMKELGIAACYEYDHPVDTRPLYEDYPFFFVSFFEGFHGRTFGALSLSNVRPVHKRGYPALGRVHRIRFNAQADMLNQLIDKRKLPELLKTPGLLLEVLASGRIPQELLAAVVLEAVQGEGGYHFADRSWIQEISDICKSNNVCVISDEIQTFARTGRTFAMQHFGIEPDIIALSKAAITGVTLASSAFTESLELGWHSNTWGGGKVLDNNFAYTVMETYLNYGDPVFEGRTYQQNQELKAELIAAGFEWLCHRHSRVLHGFTGLGGMWGFSVSQRDMLCQLAQKAGLKLLSCGVTRERSSIRALFLSDVLTSELCCFFRLLDSALAKNDNHHCSGE